MSSLTAAFPWGRFPAIRRVSHTRASAIIWAGSRFPRLANPHVVVPVKFERAEVIYLHFHRNTLPPARYQKLEFDRSSKEGPTRTTPLSLLFRCRLRPTTTRKTIVTARQNIQLHNDVALPNVVALLEKMPGNPRDANRPPPPPPVSRVGDLAHRAPQMERSVVASLRPNCGMILETLSGRPQSACDRSAAGRTRPELLAASAISTLQTVQSIAPPAAAAFP